MRKLAMIRTNDEEGCPFGLPIPFGCKCAGKNVENMAPLDIMEKMTSDEKEMISTANTKLLAHNLLNTSIEPEQCPYVGHIISDKVECNYDDTAPGQGAGAGLISSPFYSRMFDASIAGISTVPSGYFSDYNSSKNNYYSMLSYQGATKDPDIVKMAKEILNNKHTDNLE